MNENIYGPLVACRVNEGAELVRITIVPDGRVESRSGTFVIDAEAGKRIEAAFHAHGTRLPIDYEHQTLGGAYASPTGTAPAAGWIEDLHYEAGVGITADVKWTDEGRAMIRADKYRYLSPVLTLRKSDGKVIELHSAALTNKPAIPGMERVAAKEGQPNKETDLMKGIKEWFLQAHQEESAESPDQLVGELKAALKAKGVEIADGATREDILRAAIRQLEGGGEETAPADTQVAASVRDVLGLAGDADKGTVLEALSQRVPAGDYNAIKSRLDAVEQANKRREADDLVAAHIASGQLLETDRERMEWAHTLALKDPETFQMAMKGIPDQRPPQGRTTPPPGGPGAPGGREQIIAKARAQHGQEETLRACTSVHAYVNDQLRIAGQNGLSDKEVETLAV